MEPTLIFFNMIISGLVFFTVISKLVKRQLSESNSFLWFFVGFLTLIAGFFPGLVNRLAAILGIAYPPTLLFVISTIILMMFSFKCSIDISKAEAKINEIAMIISILKEENRRLTETLENELRNNPKNDNEIDND